MFVLESLDLDLQMRGYKPATRREYRRILAREQPPTLDKPDIVRWILAADTQSGRRWRYLAINALCRMLVDEGELSANPCERIKMPKERATPQPVAADDAVRALLSTCDASFLGKRDRAVISVLASTGCRRAELCGMRLTDVNVRARQVVIRNGKADTWRVAYLDEVAARAVLTYLRGRKGGPMLWTNRLGEPLTPRAVTMLLQSRSRRAGVRVSAHQFRRRMAINWLLEGGSQVGLMNAAGWSTSEMAARYAQTAAQRIAESEFARMQTKRAGR